MDAEQCRQNWTYSGVNPTTVWGRVFSGARAGGSG
jgi:hypothetical protein